MVMNTRATASRNAIPGTPQGKNSVVVAEMVEKKYKLLQEARTAVMQRGSVCLYWR
jgi:hypothetical protein